MNGFWQTLLNNISNASWYEWVAVISGIVSVWFSRSGNILVYPVGIIGTALYIFICLDEHLAGEAAVNIYYTVMSVIGWLHWIKRDPDTQAALPVSFSSTSLLKKQMSFFAGCFIIIASALFFLKKYFYPGALPLFDGFAAATAFTGMWLMTLKKVESWYWWIATNIVSVPLYAVKGLALSSVYYFILLLLAVAGLLQWKRLAAKGMRTVMTTADHAND